MKPLNRAERNNAFLGFLLFFSLTIFIVIIVALQSTKVTLRENEQLRRRMIAMQNEKNLSDSFKVAMDVVLNEVTKFDQKKDPVDVIQRRVQLKIESMGRIVKDIPDENSIYDLIIQNLSDLSAAKLRIRNLQDQGSKQ
jgi:hypothetical protein